MGIFRLSGSKLNVDKLLAQWTRSSTNADQIAEEKPSLQDATGVLKQIFGQMKLFNSPALQDKFLKLGEESLAGMEEQAKISQLKDLVAQLPAHQQEALKAMLNLLGKVSGYKDENKMDVNNLAIVFGPRLVWKDDPAEELQIQKPRHEMAVNLITYRDQIFS